MKIHEYQAKALLNTFGVSILPGQLALSVEEAVQAAQSLGGSVWVVKSQIHAGGRGKGGGIKLVRSLEEVRQTAQHMLGMKLITPQTGPEGQQVRRLYIESGCAIAQELYFSMLIDRKSSRIALIGSAAGGMDIEAVAAQTPEKIVRLTLDPLIGMQPYHARQFAFKLGLTEKSALKAARLFMQVYQAFCQYEANLIEINPLVVTQTGEVIALDAKMTFDENALERQPEIVKLRDIDEENPREYEAAQNGLSYVKLDGDIGCLVNGAGLAMATMDAIKLYGGNPANFLDVGGGAPKERVVTAFRLILSDPHVKAILVNIFGGIMRCDTIAEGIIAAAREVNIKVPLVVRLEGTHVELGKKILAESQLPIIAAHDLGQAAEKVVQAVKEGQ